MMELHSTQLPKPTNPYLKGRRFTIQSHITPPPTPVTYNCLRNYQHGIEERRQFSPVDRCLRNPPLLGATGSCTLDIEILELLKAGDGHNSQVFTIRTYGSRPKPEDFPQDKVLVAKVYDPLYYDDGNGYMNPFLCMDKHYTHEVRAYEILSEMQGRYVPKFYGAYSLDICVEESQVRTVRLILMEYVPGQSMQQINPRDYPQSQREQTLKAIVELESQMFKHDIMLPDLSPRNVMLSQRLGSNNPTEEIVFIDFEAAIFGRRRDDSTLFEPKLFLGQYISPLLRWTTTLMWPFCDWVDWDWAPWVKKEFAHTAGTITPEMREVFTEQYGPLEE